MSSPLEAHRLMMKHAEMVERIAQWLVNLGRIPHKDFEEACSFGRVGLAEGAHSHEQSRGTEASWLWIHIYGAICTGMKREHRERRRLVASALDAAGDYAGGLSIPASLESMSPAEALGELRDRGDGFLAALALGHLSGIWRLDPEAQLTAREEHPAALAALAAETGKLAEREQRLLQLHYTEGLPWPEVAARFGVHKSTVERWHAAAIRRVAKGLRERGVGASPRPLDTG